MSREVHDELGQSLTALKMDLFQLDKSLPPENPDLRKRTRSMVALVDSTIKSVQRIAMELRPPVLDAFGLCEAIAWQAGEYEKRFGITFDLNCLQSDLKIDKDLNTTFFRIFQESITNVVRHAEASKVSVSMSHHKGQLVMEIQDNGKGIRNDQIEGSDSLGLIGIRERVRYWNGEVQFQGAPEKGTLVKIRIPLSKK
jgi:signal transduction histidine kinase